jgi:putative addiction module killer protein
MISKFEIFRYQAENGREPFTEWLSSLRDSRARAKVYIRIRRLEAGSFGDSVSVGEGVIELREHLGTGYRMYFARHGLAIVILLCGGDKRTQTEDIKTAKKYWEDWKRRQA